MTGVAELILASRQLIVSRLTVADGRNTAAVRASVSRQRPADVRPTRPLPRNAVCAAITRASPGGQPGNSFRIASAMGAARLRSSSARRTSSSFAPSGPLLGTRKAFFFGAFQRNLLYQDAFAFVPST